MIRDFEFNVPTKYKKDLEYLMLCVQVEEELIKNKDFIDISIARAQQEIHQKQSMFKNQ